MRVIVIAAHPDEAEGYAGGTIALFAEQGHDVKIVSMTCGDAGHHEMGRLELAARRYREAQLAADRLGVREYDVHDTHDGELMPDLETRKRALKAIRAWQADVVISLHPDGGGHPDNRAVGRAVDDAMAFATNRNVMPDVPPLERQPLHLYMIDYITMRVHRHDVVVDIDPVIEKKLLACDAHASQFYEYSARTYCDPADVPKDWAGRRAFILEHWKDTLDALPEMRPGLERWYPAEHAASVTYAETFQYAHDSHVPNANDLRQRFPILA